MIVPQYVFKVYQSSRQLNYTFEFYNGCCKVCEKNLSPPQAPNEEKKPEEIKPNLEGLYFTIALSNLSHILYVGSRRWRAFAV